MIDYEEMSDFEINILVYCHVKNKDLVGAYKTNGWFDIAVTDNGDYFGHNDIPNYSSNPSNLWGIIVENKISIAFGSELTTARLFTCTNLFEVIDKNPLRAACICFLKMKDADK